MRKFALGLGCAAMLGTAGTAWAAPGDTITTYVDENFDSYGSTSAMEAVWVKNGQPGGTWENTIDDDQDGTPELDGAISGDGGFAFHPGLGVNELILTNPIVPTETEWIRLTADIYDNATDLIPILPPNPSNKRMSVGLRPVGVVENFIELGMWNGVDDIHFAYRATAFGVTGDATSPNWAGWDLGTEAFDIDGSGEIDPDEQDIPVNRYRGGGWHQYIVTITPDTLIFEFDLDRDGTIDGTDTYTGLTTTAAGFQSLRFGSPSSVSSEGGGVTFDNIKLESIEPDAPALDGDLNGDGFVGVDDLNIVLVNWNQDVPAGSLLDGDPTGDAFVGVDDLNIILVNWNNGTPPISSVVPEPTTLALLGLGGLAMLRRR